MAYDMPPSPMARDVAFLLKHFDAKATEAERLRAENAALAGERDRLREALQRLERCFQGDWPTIEIALRSNENAPYWLRGPVDDETRDAVVQARKCLGRMDTKEEV